MLRPAAVDALLLGAGDVAAGDDRAEQQHRGAGREGLQAAEPGGLRRGVRGRPARAPPSSARAPHGHPEQQAEQEHRQAEVGGDQLLGEVLLDGEAAEPRLDEHQHARGDRRARSGQRELAQVAVARVQASSAISPTTTAASRRWENSMITSLL